MKSYTPQPCGHCCHLVFCLGRSQKEKKDVWDHRRLPQVLVGQDPLQNLPRHTPEILPAEGGARPPHVSESSAAEVSTEPRAALLLPLVYVGSSLLLTSRF